MRVFRRKGFGYRLGFGGLGVSTPPLGAQNENVPEIYDEPIRPEPKPIKHGRPNISLQKQAALWRAYDNGASACEAAKELGCHRNTANKYFQMFRRNSGIPSSSQHFRQIELHIERKFLLRLEQEASRRNLDLTALCAQLLETIARDNLIGAVWGDL